MTGFIRSQYANIGAAGTAAVMALTLVSVPPGHAGSLAARPEVAAVQLQAAVATEVAALMNSSLQAAAVGIDSATTPVASAGDAVIAPLASTADATAVDDVLTSIGRVALTVAGTVLSPIWYLAFPITMGLGSLWGYMNPINRADVVGAIFFLTSAINIFSWLSFPFRLGEVVFPPNIPETGATRSAATVHTIDPEAPTTGLPLTSDSVDVQDPSVNTMNTVAALAASTSTPTDIDDALRSVGRVVFNIAGTLLSPIWYLAAPITAQLGSLWGYVEPLLLDPLLGVTFAQSMANVMKWMSFPFRLGEVLFPPNAPETAATRPAATVQAVSSNTEVTAAGGTSGPATAADETKPSTPQPTRQRSTTTARSAAMATGPSEPDASITVAQGTTTFADEPLVPTRSDLVSEVATASNETDPQESASPDAISQSTGSRKSVATTPSGQRGDNSASTRSSRSVSN
ncbi:MAG: hypothetical protein QG671_3355 [Actinomycetota bacterium]|nr:hypothetical protein [Actinomycetota bacterium]